MAAEGSHPNDWSCFVGDLAIDVDDALLEHSFRVYYPSVRSAKVMLDPITLRSRGYGFVRFGSEAERDRAVSEMNGVFISTRPIRVSLATAKGPRGAAGGTGTPAASSTPASQGGASAVPQAGTENDANNTTLFVGGLSPGVTEADLHAAFSRYGEIVYTKIPAGKGCGFVQFVSRPAAEYALQEMNGVVLGGQAIRLSWGRSTGKAPPPSAHHSAPHAGGQYGGFYPGYDPYSAAAYGGYGMGAGAYDPYSAYSMGYPGMDPYAAYSAYGMAAGASGYPSMAAAAAASAAAAAHGPGPVQPLLYDPLNPPSVEKMNLAYMHRHIPVLTGAYVRVPLPMAMTGPM